MPDNEKKPGYVFTKEELEAQNTPARKAIAQPDKKPKKPQAAAGVTNVEEVPAVAGATTLPEVTVDAPATPAVPAQTAAVAPVTPTAPVTPAAAVQDGTQEDAPPVESFDVDGLKAEDVPGLKFGGEVVVPQRQVSQPVVPTNVTTSLAEKMSDDQWLQEHPWATETDYRQAYKQYKDLTPSQLMRDVAAWRQKNGGEVASWEWYDMLAGRDPYETERERQKRTRRAAWADRINAIGDVVNHFVNFGRAMGGNPIAQVQNTYNPEQSTRLRMAEEQLRRQRYQDYVNAMERKFKYKEALEAEQRKYERQKELAAYSASLRRNPALDAQKVKTEEENTKLARQRRKQARLKTLGIPDEQRRAKERHEKQMEVWDSQISRNNRSGNGRQSGGKNTDNQSKPPAGKPYYVIDKQGNRQYFSSDQAALKYALALKGETYDPQDIHDMEDLIEAGVKIVGNDSE